MAVNTGTITGEHGLTTPAGVVFDGSTNDIFGMYVTATFTGTYTSGGGNQAQLTGVPTAVETFMHDGRTLTMISACFVAPGDESGVGPIGAGPTITVSGANLTFPLTGTDLVTEHVTGTLGFVDLPIQFYVTFKAAPVD